MQLDQHSPRITAVWQIRTPPQERTGASRITNGKLESFESRRYIEKKKEGGWGMGERNE